MTTHKQAYRIRSAAGQQGQAAVYLAMLLPLLFSLIGLAIDGGIIFGARRDLQNAVDAAARRGAMQIDVNVYDASNGRTVVLDREAAIQAAAGSISNRSGQLATSIDADTQMVVVSLSQSVPTTFLQLVGISHVKISATARAVPQHGITGRS